MRYFVTFPSGDEVPVDVDRGPSGDLSVSVRGKPVPVDALSLGDASRRGAATSVRVGDRVIDLVLEGTPPSVGVIAGGRRFYAEVESARARALASSASHKGGAGERTVASPMPGRVLKVLVAEGDAVEPGAALVVVEAMKMENELAATRAGTVKKVYVIAGQTVESGTPLVEIA